MFARGIVLLCVLVAISKGGRPPICNYPPNACPKIYKPVCGTDRVTYANECLLCAASASDPQISVRNNGPCPRVCGNRPAAPGL